MRQLFDSDAGSKFIKNLSNNDSPKEDFKEKYFESATQVEILKVQIEDYKVKLTKFDT